jgi:hypothetical protein
MNMQQTTGGCGRVVKNKSADGSIRNFTFSIVKNLRLNSKPTHITLEKILTLKESEFATQANTFWKIAEEKISALIKSGKLWQNDKSKIEKRFAEFIPRPAAVTKSKPETMQTIISKLAERGYTL